MFNDSPNISRASRQLYNFITMGLYKAHTHGSDGCYLLISPPVLIAYVVLVSLTLGGLIQSHRMTKLLGQRFIGLTADQLLQRMGSCTEIVVLVVQCMPNDAQHFRPTASAAAS